MKVAHTISIFLFSAVILVSFSSCLVNREMEERPITWPQVIEIQHLEDIEGVYKNAGYKNNEEKANDRFQLSQNILWFYLTREMRECYNNCIVKIDKKETNSLQITLINWSGKSIGSTILSSSSDIKLVNGYLLLPSKSGIGFHPMASGIGTESFRLYLTDGGLVGATKGKAAGLFLNVIPTIGFGSDWYFWEKISEDQQKK